MRLAAKPVLAGIALLSALLVLRPQPPDNIHAEIQQRFLEAEFGSATAFYLAISEILNQ